MARGSVRETRPGVWQLRAYAGMQTDGKERWISQTVRGTRRQADDQLTALVARAIRIRDGGVISKARMRNGVFTVREAFEAWRAYAAGALEPNGADTDEDILRNYVYPHLGTIELWRLRPNQLAAPGDPDYDPDIVSLTGYYHMLAERGSAGRRYRNGRQEPGGKPLGGQTIRRTHGVIRRALDYCVSRGWVSQNAAVGAKLPPMVKRASSTPAPADLAAFVAFLQADDPETLAFVHLMGSGARRVDMGVQWGDLQLGLTGGSVTFGARGLISARDAVSGKTVPMVRTTPTRKRKLRTVALDQAATASLLALRARAEAEAALSGTVLTETAFVFPDRNDPAGATPRLPSWFSGAFRYAKKRAEKQGVSGLAGVRPYDVRHFMITQLLAHGMAPAVVAERAGNSQRTMDAFYRHAEPARDQAAADLMAKILGKA